MTKQQERDLAALEALFLDQCTERYKGQPLWKKRAREAADRAYALDEELRTDDKDGKGEFNAKS